MRLTGDVLVSLLVFVIAGSLTIAAPAVYCLAGGADAKARLDELKDWLALHNHAVAPSCSSSSASTSSPKACRR